jgi:2,4-dienoyl-CoA reductase-like NADH-dependent reductase (Old Yellow Enzyme family)
MADLFSPITLRQLTLENRIAVSPMCQYSAKDGSASDWHLMHLGQFAISGTGLVIIEATHVEPRGRITSSCLGLYSDDNEAALKRVVDFCHAHGSAKIGLQLSHAGRKGSAKRPWDGRGQPLTEDEGAWETVGCSGIPFSKGWPASSPLDERGLSEVKQAHVDAAFRAQRIGIDLLELHAAHGYLLHEFMSPLGNTRIDRYGGSVENRIRFVLEIFGDVRQAWPTEKPFGTRISATDWIDGGWDIEDAIVLCRELKSLGCDYITVSSGGLSPAQKIEIGEGHQVPLAARIREAVDIPVMAVGMINRPAHAQDIIATGEADMIAIARGMLFDPHWTWRAAAELKADFQAPPQYIRAKKSKWLRSTLTP